MCAWVTRNRSPRLAHLGKGAASPPVASPGPGPSARGPDQRRFALWTADRGDFISPWTLDQRETSLSLWTSIDQACAAMDPHEGYAPLDRTRAFAPVDPDSGDVPPRDP